MEEKQSIYKIRKSYDEYINLTKVTIKDLKDENTSLLHKLAFFMFEYNLIKGSLPDTIKSVFDLRNSNSSRLQEIMDLKDSKLTYEELPVEIKMVIQEGVIL